MKKIENEKSETNYNLVTNTISGGKRFCTGGHEVNSSMNCMQGRPSFYEYGNVFVYISPL